MPKFQTFARDPRDPSHVFATGVKQCARAKYVPLPDGTMKLALVQAFDRPVFNPDPPERPGKASKREDPGGDPAEDPGEILTNVERASRRAKINAFDKILCNPDMDTFVTFTFDPATNEDTASYDDCYSTLKVWCGNRVQRAGLKYVIVPEHHKSGAIHFHGILNSSALSLTRARSPYTNRPLSHKGNPLFNVTDWHAGFTSAEKIRGAPDDRVKVAKYIFKYMGKQAGQKIGGRYMLSGGDLILPTYIYGAGLEELTPADLEPCYKREVDLGENGKFWEYSYL